MKDTNKCCFVDMLNYGGISLTTILKINIIFIINNHIKEFTEKRKATLLYKLYVYHVHKIC